VTSGVTSEMPMLSASRADAAFCAQCGTELEDDQEWCLECGAARTLIHRPPDWRIPVATVGMLILLVVAGFAIALVNLSHRTNVATAAPAAAATTVAAGAPTPAAAPAATAPAARPIASWPVGLSGWTVVLFSGRTKATADATAAGLAAAGLHVGVLNSSQHPNLKPGNWIVFAGRYPHGPEATAAALRLRNSGHPGAVARQVARPGGL
jgi:hypothetical protein